MHYRPTVFPVNSVKAMRACFVMEAEGKLVPFAQETFKAYWLDDQGHLAGDRSCGYFS